MRGVPWWQHRQTEVKNAATHPHPEGDFWVRSINLLPGPNFQSVDTDRTQVFGQPSDGGLEPATVLVKARHQFDLAMAVIP